MDFRKKLFVALMLGAGLNFGSGKSALVPQANASTTAGQNDAIPPSDNQHTPYMAVYSGSVNGLNNIWGIKNVNSYGAWLNRKVMWAEDNQAPSWDNVEGAAWQLAPWSVWVNALPGRRFILGVNIIPGPWDGSGPLTGPQAHIPVSLEQGAAGAYNDHYKKLATNLVKYHLANSILRLGIEFDGNWFPWRVVTLEKAKAFAEYFRQIVTTMRAVPGAEKLQFCWNPGSGVYSPFDPENAWPGDSYVDSVGLDIYDDSYAQNTYPIPANSTPDKISAIYNTVWNKVLYNGQFGLTYWKKFAEKHNKPLSFPEWGVDDKPDHHGGGDDPYFIQQMYTFITSPANNVAWQSYFNFQAGDGHHQLSPNSDGAVVTQFPKSAALFHQLFSLPVSR